MSAIRSAALIVILAVVPGTLFGVGPGSRQPGKGRLDGTGLLEAQLKLELRRAGGARAEVANRLIENLTIESGAVGSLAALEACAARKLSCVELASLLERVIPRLAERARKEVVVHLERIREEAFWEAMPRDQRHREYARVIGGQTFWKAGVVLYPVGAAKRALDEGIDELIPEIRRQLGGTLAFEREVIEDALRLREAELAGSAGLLALVIEGNRAEAERRPSAGSKENGEWRTRRVALARDALSKLRRLGQAGTIEKLKELITSLEPIEAVQPGTGSGLELDLSLSPHADRASQVSAIGRSYVWQQVVALIGDLGDREYEAGELLSETAEESLWLTVKRSEEDAIARGKLQASHRVTE